MRPPFFYLPPPHPGCSGILSATRSGTTPPTHRQSPTRRHKRPTLACPTTSSPAPKPTAHTHLLPRLPAPPSPTDTKKRLPAPEPPPYIRILTRTIRPPNRLGKSTLFLPRLPRPRRPEKRRPAPPRAPTHPPAPGKSSGARPTHPHPRPPAPLSDSLLTRPTQAPPLATPQRPKKRHPASRRPPPHAFPHLQVPPLPGRHKKSGSPLKAAALRSNRRAISYP